MVVRSYHVRVLDRIVRSITILFSPSDRVRLTYLIPTCSPPFCSENAHDTYRKIIDWRNNLHFPEDGPRLSAEAEDLVRRYVTGI